MMFMPKVTAVSLIMGCFIILPAVAQAHGDVTPQVVDTEGLEPLGEEWKMENPYRGNAKAIEIGASAYNQNCARCHGLGGVSGGIAPDLREMAPDAYNDEWYVSRVREGVNRNGITYMPRMADFISQEGLWAIRSWLETMYEE